MLGIWDRRYLSCGVPLAEMAVGRLDGTPVRMEFGTLEIEGNGIQRGYAIAFNLRGRWRRAKRIAGRAEEYFLAVDDTELPDWRCWEDRPFGVANGALDREHYLEIVHRLGTTPNGVCIEGTD